MFRLGKLRNASEFSGEEDDMITLEQNASILMFYLFIKPVMKGNSMEKNTIIIKT